MGIQVKSGLRCGAKGQRPRRNAMTEQQIGDREGLDERVTKRHKNLSYIREMKAAGLPSKEFLPKKGAKGWEGFNR